MPHRTKRTPVRRTLDRVLSKAGIGSRSEARRWIAEGRVTVNGRVVTDPQVFLDAESDDVALDGAEVRAARRLYLLLHKPKGYVTTYRDPQGRKTVYDLLPEHDRYLFPVGRLDLDTSGLLIMTNDSAFAETLTDPSHRIPKTYRVQASKLLTDEQLASLRSGVELKDGPTRPAGVRRLRDPGGRTLLEMTIIEGRNRQIRRMIAAQGAKVLKLVRVAIGDVHLGELPVGTVRPLLSEEVRRLLPGH